MNPNNQIQAPLIVSGLGRGKPLSRAQRGVTLLEMLVAVTLLTVIVLGLTSMFLQTQKAFKSGLRQVDIFEGGRSVINLMTRDLEQIADGGATNVTNFSVAYTYNSSFVQRETNNYEPKPIERINNLENVYSLSHVGKMWIGTGYAIYSEPVNGQTFTGIGTLYRYSFAANATRPPTNLYYGFQVNANQLTTFGDSVATNFHRVADGVIHFQVRAFDTNGIELFQRTSDLPPVFPTIATNVIVSGTNLFLPATNLPGYLEIELGLVEPETLAQARSMGNANSISNFLYSRMSKVHVFRQQVPIRSAPIAP